MCLNGEAVMVEVVEVSSRAKEVHRRIMYVEHTEKKT